MREYIQTGALREIRRQVPGSVPGESVTVKLRRDLDGFWFNFAADAFQVGLPAPEAMAFDADEVWKESFTPNAAGTYSCWITYEGAQVAFVEFEAVGTPAPAAYTGTGIVSEAELEAYLETTIGSTLADILINSATAFLERACNRVFKAATYTNEYINGDGTKDIWLAQWPIVSITSLTLFDQYSKTDLYTLTDGTDYVLFPNTGRLETICGAWSKGSRNYRATYVAGYAIIPDDLKELCMDIISLKLNKKGNQGFDSQTIGRYSVTFSKESLPADIKSRMDQFKRVVF